MKVLSLKDCTDYKRYNLLACLLSFEESTRSCCLSSSSSSSSYYKSLKNPYAKNECSNGFWVLGQVGPMVVFCPIHKVLKQNN